MLNKSENLKTEEFFVTKVLFCFETHLFYYLFLKQTERKLIIIYSIQKIQSLVSLS
jgi:hypothetical protein